MTDLSGFSMMDLFRTEVETQGQQLTDGLLALETTANPAEAAEPLMRAAHSIKGAARVVGIDAVVKVAHAMEDAFVAAQKQTVTLTADAIDALLGGVDLIAKIANLPEGDVAHYVEAHQDAIEQATVVFRDIQAGKMPSPVATPAPAATEEPAPPAAPVEPAPPEPAAQPEPAPAPKAEEPSAPPTTPKPKPTPPEPSVDREAANRIVRVSAENLSRLLGLAGESLVQTRWFPQFVDSQLRLRRQRLSVLAIQDEIQLAVAAGECDRALERLQRLRDISYQTNQAICDQISQFERAQIRMTRLAEQLYQEVISSRMRPFSDGTGGFGRMVRDLARGLGKSARLEIVGEDTPVDRDILEKLEAPLTHLLRNAVDHGLETSEQRQAAGKDPTGRIILTAQHVAGMLCITLSDDGSGVNVENIRRKVIDRGLAGKDMAEQMTRDELLEFLFLPGFSTRKEVSETSGRGVGLDVVQTMLQEVRGAVQIETTPGRGTTFHMQLPLTLSVIPSLLVQIAGEPYAVPLYRVDHCLHIEAAEIQQIENRQYLSTDLGNIGLVSSRQVLEFAEEKEEPDSFHVVVTSSRAGRFGFIVDQFLGERDLVIRPVAEQLGKIPDVHAAALMEDGSPLIVLDMDDMIHSAEQILTTGRLLKVRPDARQQNRRTRRILVVDDSITVREVQRRLLESAGYDVAIAVDGADGWNAVRSGHFDLLISDIDMPRMNGIELTRHVRAETKLHDLPIMIVSYKDREEDRLAGLEAGANYYLTKSSFQDETLLRAVVDLIGEANA